MNIDFIRKEFDALVAEKKSVKDATEALCHALEERVNDKEEWRALMKLIVDITRNMIGEKKHAEAARKNHWKPKGINIFDMSIFEIATLISLSEEQYRALGLSLVLIKYNYTSRENS